MAFYKIEWRRSTKKDPRPNSSKKLSGSEFTYQIRIGNYRVIYEIHDEIILIEVVKVEHRKDVYNKKTN
jgi:mRNA interferase RelE/StbE